MRSAEHFRKALDSALRAVVPFSLGLLGVCEAGESEGGQSKIKLWSFQTLGLEQWKEMNIFITLGLGQLGC